MLAVRLIGRFEIVCDGKPVAIPSRVGQSLFAYLIMTPGTQHRREKLAGMFWPDSTEERARAYLRHELWRIRKALSSPSDQPYIVSDAIGVAFEASAQYRLDVRHLTGIQDDAPCDELIEALSVVQGELLPGFYEEWIVLEREHLQAVYERKVARLLKLLEEQKRWREILEWAERWISYGERSEAAYRALMVAYDALGDRASVISTYERCVQVLRALDLEPSEGTRALAAKRRRSLSLPIPLTSFIGREKEVSEVAALLVRARLVTLTGTGGVGKTRLSIQVAAEVLERFPDGVWFLDLAPLQDPDLIPSTLASQIGLEEASDAGLSLTDQLIHYFRSRTALVIFDNCEHLIEPVASLVHALVSSCEGLSILATSREALRLAGEIPYRVPSLEVPQLERDPEYESLVQSESVQLFAERARAQSPGFTITPQNAFSVARICQRLDGIPMAIELAAARTNVLAVEQILQRLHDRFHLLTAGTRTALARQQTLWATVEWSYSLLPPRERILFRRLAVFSGGWTLEAAEEVCAGEDIQPGEVLDLLSQLTNKSLLLVDLKGIEPRYRRLETIREFAREKLIEATEAGRLQDKHLAYFRKKAEKIEPDLVGAGQAAAFDYLDAELDNIRLALEWSLSNRAGEQALRLFGALGWFWIIRCHFREAVAWFKRALECGESASKNAQAKALFHAASLYWIKEDISTARTILKKSLALYYEAGAMKEISDALVSLGVVELSDRNTGEAFALLTEALRISRQVDNKSTISRALFNLGNISWLEGKFDIAAQQLEESLIIGRQTQDNHLISMALLNAALFTLARNDIAKTREYSTEALMLSLGLKNRRVIVYSLLAFAELLSLEGFYTQGAQLQGFAANLLHDLSAKLTEPELEDMDRTANLLKERLGKNEYQKEFDVGARLSLEQAVSLALETGK